MEPIQQLYQDICHLVNLAYPAEVSLITYVAKEAFVTALNDGKLQLEVMKHAPQCVEAAISHAIKLEAFERVLFLQGNTVDHDDVPNASCILSVQLQIRQCG